MRGKHERRGFLAWWVRKPSERVDRSVIAALTAEDVDRMRQHWEIVEDLTRCVQIGWRSYPDHVDEQLDRLAAIARAREEVR